MLLFLLRDKQWAQPNAPGRAPAKGGYARELRASGLFLLVWCVLRLLSAHGDTFAIDSALALPCLALGLWAMSRSDHGVERVPLSRP